MATIYDLAGTTNHEFKLGGPEGITVSYGKSLPLDSYGNIGDVYVRTTTQLTPDEFYDTYAEMESAITEIREKLEESGKEYFYIRIKQDENHTGSDSFYKLTMTSVDYIGVFGEKLGKLYYKSNTSAGPKWISMGVYHFDEPIIKSVEEVLNQGDFFVSLKNGDNNTARIDTSSNKETDYELNHDNYGVTRYGTDAEVVASEIQNYKTYSSSRLPNVYDSAPDKFIAETPKQIADNIKVEMKRAITVEGTLESMTTRNTTDLVSGINELDADLGTVDSPMTQNSTLSGKTISTGNNTDISVAPAISLLNDDVKTNKDNIGTMSNLTTRDKSTLVNAIDELDADLGTVSSPMTAGSTLSGKTISTGENTDISVAPAISLLNDDVKTNRDNIGTMSNLTTDEKTTLVGAINEVDAHTDTNTSNIGTMSNLTTDNKTTLVEAINEVDAHTDTNTADIAQEILDRQHGDNNLQRQIDAITSKSDVVDVVSDYSDLTVYDTSSLNSNDIIKVLEDETDNDATTYYRWSPVPTTPEVSVATKQALDEYSTSGLVEGDVALVSADETHSGAKAYYEWRKVNGTFEWVYAGPTHNTEHPSEEHFWDYIGQEGSYYTRGEADERFVHLTTDETINGTKTFSTTPIVGTVAENDSSTNAASTAYVTRAITTEDGKVVHNTGNENVAGVKTFTNGITLGSSASLDGTSGTVTVPTKAQTDNSTNAASTAYVRSAISAEDALVVHLAGAETITGNKTFGSGTTTTVSGSISLGSNATATTQASNDSSTKVATTAWVNDTNNNVVHKTGNETITGTKTFAAQMFIKGSDSNPLGFLYQGGDTGNLYLGLQDSNGEFSDNVISLIKDGNSNIKATLSVALLGTTPATTYPQPTETSSTSSTQIATVGWINDSSITSNVVHKDGTETITGAKTFSSNVVVPQTPTSNTHATSKKYVDDGLGTKQDTIQFTSSNNGQVLSNDGTNLTWKTVRDITTLAGLDDTTISSATTGQTLVYDATASKWKNENLTTATIKYW